MQAGVAEQSAQLKKGPGVKNLHTVLVQAAGGGKKLLEFKVQLWC